MSYFFSIIVPVYGVDKYLKCCIDSILRQTYDNFELLLVDDGSKGLCSEICDKYAQKDSRVKVIHKPNGGVTTARKAGASACVGEYVFNIDGDDWVDNRLLEAINKTLEEKPVDVVCYGSFYFYEENKNSFIEQKTNACPGYYDKKKIIEQIYPYLIEDERGNYFSHNLWSKAIMRELYVPEQLKLNDGINIGDDAAVTKAVIAEAKDMKVLDESFYYYRQNVESITKKRKPFDVYGAKKVGQHLDLVFGIKSRFKEQIYRYVVHNLFTSCITQYYTDDSKLAKKIIYEALEDEYYKIAIRKCMYSKKYIKGMVASVCLRRKLFFLLGVLSKIYK